MVLQFVSMINSYLAAQQREEGQGMAEYALIIALVAIIAAAALGPLGTAIAATFNTITSSL